MRTISMKTKPADLNDADDTEVEADVDVEDEADPEDDE